MRVGVREGEGERRVGEGRERARGRGRARRERGREREKQEGEGERHRQRERHQGGQRERERERDVLLRCGRGSSRNPILPQRASMRTAKPGAQTHEPPMTFNLLRLRFSLPERTGTVGGEVN